MKRRKGKRRWVPKDGQLAVVERVISGAGSLYSGASGHYQDAEPQHQVGYLFQQSGTYPAGGTYWVGHEGEAPRGTVFLSVEAYEVKGGHNNGGTWVVLRRPTRAEEATWRLGG